MGVIIFTFTIFTAIMSGLNNTDDQYIIVDNNESESAGLFNVPTGQFRGLEDSIAFPELGDTGAIMTGGLILFIGFIILFWIRGTN